jgi:hypothetical protein
MRLCVRGLAPLFPVAALAALAALAGCFDSSSGNGANTLDFGDSGSGDFDGTAADSGAADDSTAPRDATMSDTTDESSPEASPGLDSAASPEAAPEAGMDAMVEASVDATTDAAVDAGSDAMPAVCGDGIIESGEQCDGTNLGGATCQSLHGAGAGGTLACSASCQFVASSCQWCGDGIIDNGELCDGTAVGLASCASVLSNGSATGTLTCAASCQAYDVASCVCPGAELVCGSTPACVDPTSDNNNCGGCGNVCGTNSACTTSHCTTVMVPTLTSPIGIALDANNIYYTDDGNGLVYSVPKAGGASVALVTSGQAASAWDIIVVGSSVYWSTYNQEKILSVPITGGAASTLSSVENVPAGLASDGTSLFWANSWQEAPAIRAENLSTGLVSTLDLPGDGGTVVIGPSAIAVDGTYVYWGNEAGAGPSSVYRANKDGSNPIQLATTVDPVEGITVDATNVYFTVDLGGGVYSVPIGGGATTPIATGEANPTDIVTDATSVYWLNGAGVRKAPKSGGPAITLGTCNGNLSTISPYCGRAVSLAVDATYVYWTDEGTQYGHGAVFRVPNN